MATTTTTIKNGTASNADFQAFCQAINTAMAAAGWEKTTDTGQIVNTTVVNPAINTKAGYEIWIMKDSLQSEHPVTLKIQYGNTGTTATHGLWLQIGLGGTNGAGTLSGSQLSTEVKVSPQEAPGAASYQLLMSGATNRVTMFHGIATGANAKSTFGFSIERDHTNEGTDSTDGVFMAIYGCLESVSEEPGAWFAQYIPFSGTVPPAQVGEGVGRNMLCMPWYGANEESRALGTVVGVIPLLPVKAAPRNPSQCLAGYQQADITNNTTLTLPQNGNNHTFKTIGTWVRYMDNQPHNSTSSTTHCCMMRWE